MPGYARRSQRVDGVQYDQLHTYWNATVGGQDAVGAYRRYVNEGLVDPQEPFMQQLREWVIGSEDFLRRMIALAEGGDRPAARNDDPASSRRHRHGGLGGDRVASRSRSLKVRVFLEPQLLAETWLFGCVVAGRVSRSGSPVRPLDLTAPTAFPTRSAVPSSSPRDPPAGESVPAKAGRPPPEHRTKGLTPAKPH